LKELLFNHRHRCPSQRTGEWLDLLRAIDLASAHHAQHLTSIDQLARDPLQLHLL